MFRTNLVAGMQDKKIVAEKLYRENTKHQFFEDWFEFELLPVLQKGCTIIMDNTNPARRRGGTQCRFCLRQNF
jgi:transposase